MKYLKKDGILLFCLTVFLLQLGIASHAEAQQESVEELIRMAMDNGMEQSGLTELQARAESRGMSREQLVNIIKPAVGLAEQNLPGDHLIQKALEGLSKGVPDAQVVSVIGRMSSSTQQAAKVVEPWMSNPDVQKMIERSDGPGNSRRARNRMIETSSRAIAQNIPAETINQILSEISNESVLSRTASSDIVAAIGILPDLSAGDQSEVAQDFVVRALKGGFDSGELQKLPMAVNMAQKRSQLPAAGILKGASQQLQAGTPSSQVLQSLFKGNIGGGPPGNTPGGLPDNPGQGDNPGQDQGQGRGNN